MADPKFEIKNFKSAGMNHDGEMWSLSLYLDGKRVARVMQSGHGGPNDYDWFDRDAEAVLADHAKTLPPDKTKYGTFNIDSDSFVYILIDKMEEQKMLKRISKKGTPFRVKGDKKGLWRSVNCKGQQAIEYLKKEFGDKIEVIHS